MMGVEAIANRARPALFRLHGDIFKVRHANLAALSVKDQRARKPADRNQSEQFGFTRTELKHRNGVLRAVTDK